VLKGGVPASGNKREGPFDDELLLEDGGASGPIDGISGLREYSAGAPADTGGPEAARWI